MQVIKTVTLDYRQYLTGEEIAAIEHEVSIMETREAAGIEASEAAASHVRVLRARLALTGMDGARPRDGRRLPPVRARDARERGPPRRRSVPPGGARRTRSAL